MGLMGAPKGNQYAVGNPGGGRATLYRRAYCRIVKVLCERGATDREIAEVIGVALPTLYEWRNRHKEFSLAWAAGKEAADQRVERALFKRALGYEEEAVKIFMPAGAAEPVYAPYTEKIAPDVTAQIFWLKSRKSEWREKAMLEITGKDGGPIAVESEVRHEVAKVELEGLRKLIANLEGQEVMNGNGRNGH
jgi:hypothetical protein